MNQFPEENSQAPSKENVQAQQFTTCPSELPTTVTNEQSTGRSPERVESNLNRFGVTDSCSPDVSQYGFHQFDMLAYAQLTSTPSTSRDQAAHELTDFSSKHRNAEIDPYVDPAELALIDFPSEPSNIFPSNPEELRTAPESSKELNPGGDLANQTLEHIENFRQQLELLDSENSSRRLPPSQPTVEIIGANSQQTEAREETRELTAEMPTAAPDDEALPVAWFTDSVIQAPANRLDPLVQNTAIPIVNQETGEAIFDIRDFSDSADGVIEPIPGSCDLEAEMFEFKTVDEIQPCEIPRQPTNTLPHIENAAETQAVPRTQDQVFVAGTGDVIQVNGSDGFDHLDLTCFDVKWATFSDQRIRLDNRQGTSFEIRYHDIAYALFADGVEVRLDSDDAI